MAEAAQGASGFFAEGSRATSSREIREATLHDECDEIAANNSIGMGKRLAVKD